MLKGTWINNFSDKQQYQFRSYEHLLMLCLIKNDIKQE